MSKLKPIGIIHSSYKGREEAPSQGRHEIREVEVFPQYEDGLEDIQGFSHLHILYWLHDSVGYSLSVKTPWNGSPHGLFATRTPHRPNPIGYSVVELMSRAANVLTVRGLDAVEGTPVIDIKPYIERIDSKPEARGGWLEERAHFFKPKIYEYRTSTRWDGEKEGTLEALQRHSVKIGCPPEFGGKPDYWTPEHLLVASIDVCIMTTFLWLLAKEPYRIVSYESEAVGRAHMVGSEFEFSKVEVKPRIAVVHERDKEAIYDLLLKASEQCLISRSLKCRVELNALIEVGS